MKDGFLKSVRDRVPGAHRVMRAPRQLIRRSPFKGDITPTRVPIIAPWSGRPSLPFPHPWNYHEPLRILATYFWKTDDLPFDGRHNRFIDVAPFAPVLVTRDPQLIRAISTNSGLKEGHFDRDTMPSAGIARATGVDSLLYANGDAWKRQKKLATPPFARATLFQPEHFEDFAKTFRHTATDRLGVVSERLEPGADALEVSLEPEIKAVMLEMLVNNFFGAEVPYTEIRERYVPALERVIDHIVRDTVVNKLGVPLRLMPGMSDRLQRVREARDDFERLTDLVIATRHEARGLWRQFRSDATDDALRSNIRVFLAGALEATTSYASWALSHLARHPEAQAKVYDEVKDISVYTPETLATATYLGHVLNETLRLTPALYFHPRRARDDTWVETNDERRLYLPKGTHVLLDIWHANRHDDHWGVDVTGFPAAEFVPERWAPFSTGSHGTSEALHFGFGHGPRFCPGKSLGQLETALVVGACVKMFELSALSIENPPQAAVSTKPLDGVKAMIRMRD